jgi:hypothetical protein
MDREETDINSLAEQFHNKLTITAPSAYEKICKYIDNFNEKKDPSLTQWLQAKHFFITDKIDQLLRTLGALLDCALGQTNPVYSNGDNYLLTGIKGVGKTTLLKM